MDPPPQPVARPARYAVPFIGSGGFGYHHGSAFPGATAPHGLAKVGPDTKGPFGTVRFLHYSGYWYGDDTVQGFSHLHLHGTGACDYGVLAVMPLDGFSPERTTPDGYGLPLRKATEEARPGYYAVTLARPGGPDIRTEITATPHAAHHRYRFSGTGPTQRALLFDLDHHLNAGEVASAEVQLDPARQELTGKLRSVGEMSRGYGGYDVFFVARTRTKWASQLVWSDGAMPAAGTQARGKGVGLVLLFNSPPSGTDEALELQVGLSLVSLEGAARNLDAELPSWQHEATQAATAAAWDRLLETLRISGGSEAERRMFYSALYRAFLMPSVHSDVDGSYLGFDGKTGRAGGFRYVSDLSLWDTYRTLHPLYSLIAPAAALDSVQSLLRMAQARGGFPKWPLAGGDSGTMIGAPAEMVIADAYIKGVTGFDAEAAYQILRAAALSATAPAGGRGGRDQVEDYMRLGYVPSSVGGSVSKTTEYARGDAALAGLAAALGHTGDARRFGERARSYRALYDPKVGFLRGRAADSTFSWRAYDPTKYTDEYTEANGWQSLWMNDHDAVGSGGSAGTGDGLIELLGGREPFVRRLGEMFDSTRAEWEASDPSDPLAGTSPPTYYWAGNEGDIHAPYLFALAGRPDLTQRWVRWLMDTQYRDAPAGLPGNDDGGTMSAWYLFSALGLFPIAGTDLYVLGAPRFPRIEVALPGGTFTIEAPGVSAARPYAVAVALDGVPVTAPVLRHAELRAGRTLRFTMAAEPAAR
jgi:predicted alpha-1,2-mannosidase